MKDDFIPFPDFPDDPCKNCVTSSPCFVSSKCPELDFDPEILLCNIWLNYKMCKANYAELDLHFRLFVEFKDEITECYNNIHSTDLTSMELLQMIVNPSYDIETQLSVLRRIFGGTGIDLPQLNEIIGAKAFSSLFDMKTYDTFYNSFIDRSSYYAFIYSLTNFIFD